MSQEWYVCCPLKIYWMYLEGTAPCDVLMRPIAVPAVIQVLSRYWALWGIVEVAPEAVKNGALKLLTVGDVTLQLNIITLLFSWSATEILRYGFYAAKVGMLHLPMPSRHRQTHHVTSASTCFVHLHLLCNAVLGTSRGQGLHLAWRSPSVAASIKRNE